MKPVLAAMALLVSSAAGPAGFRVPVPLGELIGTADAVVVGKVQRVEAKSFSFAAEEVLRGEIGKGLLAIEKLQPGEENPRWTTYGAGQELLLFLDRQEGCAVPWRIAGRIGEGEVPLDGEHAYFPGRHLDFLERAYHDVQGARAYLQRIEKTVLIDAIRGYGRCFTWDGGRPGIVCGEQELAAYRSRSPLHDFLVRETRGEPRPG